MRSIWAALAIFILIECAPTAVASQPYGPNMNEWEEILRYINSNLDSLKMNGAPEISSLHRNEALGTPADSAICLRNSADKNTNYFVFLISENKVVDFRSAIVFDHCEAQRYMPLPKPEIKKSVPPIKPEPVRRN